MVTDGSLRLPTTHTHSAYGRARVTHLQKKQHYTIPSVRRSDPSILYFFNNAKMPITELTLPKTIDTIVDVSI